MSNVSEDEVSVDGSPWARQGDVNEMRDDATTGTRDVMSDGSIDDRETSMIKIKNEAPCLPNDLQDSRSKGSSDDESEGEDEDEHNDSDDEDADGDCEDQANNHEHANNEDSNETQGKALLNQPALDEQLHLHKSDENQNSHQRTDGKSAINKLANSQESGYSSQIRKPRLMSVEHIPESHQTLKMRLKLRAPIVQSESPEGKEYDDDDDEEEDNGQAIKEAVIEASMKKKCRGRPPVKVKKEPKKLLQISLGNQADRWQRVKNLATNLKFHSQVAKLLLDCFDKLLDGSLQWTSNSSECDLKLKLTKMLAEKKGALPNDSWLPASKKKRKAPVTFSPPKKVIYREDSQEDDFEDVVDEIAEHSTDEDFTPDKSIHKPAKRTQPKRRKQSTPRRVVKTEPSEQVQDKKVKPLKVTVSKNHIKKEELSVVRKRELGRKWRGCRKASSKQLKSPPPTRTVEIPPEFATYPKLYKCRRCPAKCEDTYATLELLQEHFVTHKQDSVVPKKKSDRSSILIGKETKDEAIQLMAKVLIRCPDCKKMFYPGRLVQHLRTAHVRVLCDECGGMFARVAMWEHKKAHKFKAEGKKPYKCDKCDKEFLWQVSLRQHRELHSKERPFICSACGKSFKTLTKMKRHEIIHEAVKPFTCPHCQRSFTQRTNLKTHIRTHTGEKPYRCDYCTKTFTYKVSMKTHMKKEHGVDLWRDGPSHRVQEFDDVKCQMKRRKNPQTQNIQNVVMPEEAKTLEEPATHEAANVAMPEITDESYQDTRHYIPVHLDDHVKKNPQDLHLFMGDQKRVIKHRMEEERTEQVHVDSRSHRISASSQEMLDIAALGETQHVKAHVDSLDHNTDQQLQNCISSSENVDQVTLRDKVQQQQAVSHELHRAGNASHQSHDSSHYTPHYLPVSTDMNLPAHQMPTTSNPSHTHVRYSSNDHDGARYSPHLSGGVHGNLRQGSLHHDMQQGGMHPSHHPRYPPWNQAGHPAGGPSPVFIQGEMGPTMINELMKMGK